MNKLKKLEILLIIGIAIPGIGLAGDCNISEDPSRQKAEVNSGMILDVLSLIAASEMQEDVRTRLLEQLQTGENLILKKNKASHCLVVTDEYCMFAKDGRFLSKKTMKEAKIFHIDPRLFDEIKENFFSAESGSGTKKIMRKAKYLAQDGGKWFLKNVVPVAGKCGWDVAKMVVKFATKNPSLTFTLGAGATALKFLSRGLTTGEWKIGSYTLFGKDSTKK
ncbi:MAG: hypothetical protein LBR92_01695 [Puniceicoccales bacterium]|jgi:hypothetical protein|nr:hypothetical protein [Puniceicoccales bacterium]